MYEAQVHDQEQQLPDLCPFYQGVLKEQSAVQVFKGHCCLMASMKGKLYKFAGALGIQ